MPGSVKLVAFAAGVPMGVQPVVPLSERSTMNPFWLFEVSVHDRLICTIVGDAEATRLLGAVGAPAVVALATLELADAPKAVFAARTR